MSHVHEAGIEDIRGVDGLVLGSGTYHHEIMPALEVFIEKAEELDLKGKIGAAFCSYGWSPEVVDLITNRLKGYGMETLDGLLIHEKPDEAGLEKCRSSEERSLTMGRATGRPITTTVLASGYMDCGQNSSGIQGESIFGSSSGGACHLSTGVKPTSGMPRVLHFFNNSFFRVPDFI